MIMTKSRPNRCAAILLGLSLVVGPMVVVTASAQSGAVSLGELLWPPQANAERQDLPGLALNVFNASRNRPVIVGVRPIDSLQLEHVNDSTSRLTIRETGGANHTIVQHHEPFEGHANETARVRPSDLQAMIELVPFGDSRVLQISGPPGTFDLTGNTTLQKARDLLAKMDYPSDPDLRAGDPSFRLLLYGGRSACVEAVNGRCNATTYFRIECEACIEVAVFFSSLNREFKENYGDDPVVGVGAGTATILFDEGGRMVAAQFTRVFDLDESSVMDPKRARDLVLEHVHGRGYRLGPPHMAEEPASSYIDEARLDLVSSGQSFRPVRAVYHWTPFEVVRLNESDGYGAPTGHSLAHIRQDAVSGSILSADFVPAERAVRDPVSLPMIEFVGIVIALLLAASARNKARSKS